MNYIAAFIRPGSSKIEIITGDESTMLQALYDYADSPYQFTSMRSALSYIKHKMPMESGEAFTIQDSSGRVLLSLDLV